MSDTHTQAIVAAVLAGAKAAEGLREEGFDGGTVLIGEEPYVVLAAMNVNVWDAGDAIGRPIRSRRPVDGAELRDPDVLLERSAGASGEGHPA